MNTFTRRLLKTTAITLLALASHLASALDIKPYDETAFAAAQAEGKQSVLMFHANWCPTCKVQDKALEALKADPALNDVVVFKANYDTATELKTTHKVRAQSTFVVFKGKSEVSRATAITAESAIKDLFKKTL